MSGVISGGVYALLALGFTLIYGVAGVLNLSHGTFYMLGAYMLFAFFELAGLGLLPSLILSIIVVAFIGIITYNLFIRPVIESELNVLVLTLSAALIVEQLIINLPYPTDLSQPIFGSGNKPVSSLLSGTVTFLGVTVFSQELLALVTSLSLIVFLWIFITKSKIGGAMRAMAQDREVAMLMGVNTERLYMLTIAISAFFAAIAAILIVPARETVAYPDMWTDPLFISFAIVVLGGLGSIKGSLVGAFIVAYAEACVAFLIPGGMSLRGAAALVVMVLVLLLKPRGLFGRRIEAE